MSIRKFKPFPPAVMLVIIIASACKALASPPPPTQAALTAPAGTPLLPTVPQPVAAGPTAIAPQDGMALVYVPAGEFLMGSTQAAVDALIDEYPYVMRNIFTAELPQRTVYLDAYWMDKTEVTNSMYARCVQAGKCTPPRNLALFGRERYYGNPQYDHYPVNWVNWNQAAAYCQWAGRRLPTEAEWEKAARGTDGRIYPWGNQKPDCSLANLGGVNGCVGDTNAVGSYPAGASPYGALDMAGNVWELVDDWYVGTYYSTAPASNPPSPSSGEGRVMRGGSWADHENFIRTARRGRFSPDQNLFDIGFRCARS